MNNLPRLCLASGSPIRRRLLEAAGVDFDVDPPDIDEAALVDEGDPGGTALRLARAKAEVVSARRAGALVLGGDQMFTLDGRFLPKPSTRDEVARKLELMSGRTHEFHCGVALVRDGAVVWETVEHAAVTFHELSADEIEAYADTGEGIGCAGAYQFEGRGMRLVKRLDGSHFTVYGLPMLPLLAELRRLGEEREGAAP